MHNVRAKFSQKTRDAACEAEIDTRLALQEVYRHPAGIEVKHR